MLVICTDTLIALINYYFCSDRLKSVCFYFICIIVCIYCCIFHDNGFLCKLVYMT